MQRTLAALVAATILCGCASTGSSTAPLSVKDGDPAIVNRDCKLLGTVSGRSLFGGSEAGRNDGAIADARAKAAALGATHMVVLKVDTSGMFNTGQATARAYKC